MEENTKDIKFLSLLGDGFKVAGEGLGTLVLAGTSIGSGLLTITAVLADPSNSDKYGAMLPLTAALASAGYTEVLADKTKNEKDNCFTYTDNVICFTYGMWGIRNDRCNRSWNCKS